MLTARGSRPKARRFAQVLGKLRKSRHSSAQASQAASLPEAGYCKSCLLQLRVWCQLQPTRHRSDADRGMRLNVQRTQVHVISIGSPVSKLSSRLPHGKLMVM